MAHPLDIWDYADSVNPATGRRWTVREALADIARRQWDGEA